jgi:glycosyltransferase involved in cell wall biosynthesis
VIEMSLVCLVLAGVPALLYLANLFAYRRAAIPAPGEVPAVSVLIPARNEERSIAAAVESVLASRSVTVEVVVLDDDSEDGTAARVAEIACRDRRVRLLTAPPLPAGWCGKQHACDVLAGAARYPLLAFLDADARLATDGLARLTAFQTRSRADLVSGIPHQETGTLLERMVIPLIHFILLGFLPMARMRRSRHPAFAAGCGQLFLATRQGYDRSGGHAAIRTTLHDGILLPRAFRAAGLWTDLCDATDLADCRMYRSAGELWHGLAKNATEGLAAPGMIVPATVLLLGGQVLPPALLAAAAWLSPHALALAIAAAVLAYLPRLISAVRFRQSLVGALLHPAGVCVLLAIQWYALVRSLLRRPATWKGRRYQPAAP